ncbi:MAG: fibro-slime domain-containing protein, partial [Fibrobacteria bacterium]|nr:fibro-slime domain-containing protein [Fibrobacteria bacterium]
MVQNNLGSNGLPVFKKDILFNKDINTWFIADTDNPDPKKRVIPVEKTLAFKDLGNNVYEFDRDGYLNDEYEIYSGYKYFDYYNEANAFFPIDNEGLVALGIESQIKQGYNVNSHNFGFTLHLHDTLTYEASKAASQVFTFTGDDDVWVFIDGKLVLDLGGIHGPLTNSFRMSDVATELGLQDFHQYTFDFFLAERMPWGSSCKITTSLAIFVPLVLPAPTANPETKSFNFVENVTLSNVVNEATIFYRLSVNDPFVPYTGALQITETKTLEAFAAMDGWLNSDTISHTYTKSNAPSVIELLNLSGEPLGGTSVLTEADSKFIVKLTTRNASITTASINVNTASGGDTETFILSNPQITNNALVFIDTLDFAITTAMAGNTIVEAAFYDVVTAAWANPGDNTDNPSASFNVKPAPNAGRIYFADAGWNEVQNLSGNETVLYVVVEDQPFDNSRLSEYVVTLTNAKGDNNTSPTDQERFQLVEITPGKYGVTIPVGLSTATSVVQSNGTFEIRKEDILTANYVDPIDNLPLTASKGFGVANPVPGAINFANVDYSMPVTLMTGGMYNAATGMVYLHYVDDYIAALTTKTVSLTVISTDGQGKKIIDSEVVNMNLVGQQDSTGIWQLAVPLQDNHQSVPGDKILQWYFNGQITARAINHKTGTVEKLTTDTSKVVLNVSYGNEAEIITVTGPTDNIITRQDTVAKVCVEDQVFSTTSIDTILLDKIECSNSGDKLTQVKLVQTSATSKQYCGELLKNEMSSGTLTDNVLSCQDLDNIVVNYTDPVYFTTRKENFPVIDYTGSSIVFMDTYGTVITGVYDESVGGQVIVRLTHKTPDLKKIDTLRVKIETDAGDTLEVLVVETSVNSGAFDAVINVGFSDVPDLNNNILEGTLNTSQASNQMTLTGTKGLISGSVIVNAAYIPVEKAWIVDGNDDGHADSIYIRFKAPLSELPAAITSIDWPYEGATGHSAVLGPVGGVTDINMLPGVPLTVSVLVPGSLDKTLNVFPEGATSADPVYPPRLTLPPGTIFQNQEVLIEDGMGAVIVSANKHPSDNSYYKDTEGNLQKQPDTLVIMLSEKIRALHALGTPWDSLFMFMSPGMGKSQAYPLIALTGVPPTVKGPDSLEWTFIVSNNINVIKPFVDDEIFMNANAPYVDASPNGNRPEEAEALIQGIKNKNPINHSTIFVPVTGITLNDPRSMAANLYIDQNGQVTPGRDAVLVQNQDGTYDFQRLWVKPPGLNADGTVSPPGEGCQMSTGESAGQTQYPENCLSTVQVFSTDTYIAEIAIFDHLGKFVHQSVQY